MNLNGNKCNLMIFGEKSNDLEIKIGNTTIIENKEERLLGVILVNKISFKIHVQSLCKRAGQKLHALSRISYLLDTEHSNISCGLSSCSVTALCMVVL